MAIWKYQPVNVSRGCEGWGRQPVPPSPQKISHTCDCLNDIINTRMVAATAKLGEKMPCAWTQPFLRTFRLELNLEILNHSGRQLVDTRQTSRQDRINRTSIPLQVKRSLSSKHYVLLIVQQREVLMNSLVIEKYFREGKKISKASRIFVVRHA